MATFIADDPAQWSDPDTESPCAPSPVSLLALAEAEVTNDYLLRRWTQSAAEAASLRRTLEMGKTSGHAMQVASPFIRQHNAISKFVEGRLREDPGSDRSLVIRLAGILDMELPDKWRASQD